MALQEPLACPRTQMQTLTRMDTGVVEDFYQMTTKDEFELDEIDTSIVNKNLNLGPPLSVHLPLV